MSEKIVTLNEEVRTAVFLPFSSFHADSMIFMRSSPASGLSTTSGTVSIANIVIS